MKRVLGLLAATLLSAAASAQPPYRNPVIPFEKSEVADPYVLKYNGEYYLYTSGDPILAFHSRDLVHWDKLGPVLHSQPGQADIWAPEVVYRNGQFLMYYTLSKKSEDWRENEMARRVGLAVADNPAGPFRDVGHPVTPSWAIDGTVFRDPGSGRQYLFYSSLQEPAHPGAGIAVDELTASDRVSGSPRMAVEGSEAWEDKDGDPNNGSLRYTNEGPTVTQRHGKIYLLYSGGSWDAPTYTVGYATARSPLGPYAKVVPSILHSTPLVDAPGHDALTKAPNNFDDVHVYHARVQPFVDPWNRAPFVDRLYWNHDRPFTPSPTLGYLPAPDQPLAADLFDGSGSPGPLWKGSAGHFQVGGGVLHAQGPGKLQMTCPIPRQCLLEVNLRGSGRFGVDLGTSALLFDAAKRALTLNGAVLWPFPAEFRSQDFHQLLLTRDADSCSVAVDGVVAGRLQGFSRPSLRVEEGQADFDGVALSGAYDEDFSSTLAGWEGSGGQFSLAGGQLCQKSESGLAWLCKGDPALRYEFSASVQPSDVTPPPVAAPGPRELQWKAGIVAGFADGALLTAGYDKAIWPLAHFWVQLRRGGRVEQSISVGMPRGFRYDEFHTIRVLRDDDRFTFFLDGHEQVASRFALGASVPGVFTENVSARFASVSAKQVVVPQNLLLDGGFESENVPWKLEGGARLNESSPHSGVRRLLLPDAGGRASQTVILAAGHYVLHAFVIGKPGSTFVLSAGTARTAGVATGQWQDVALAFEASGSTKIELSSLLAWGYLAADDFYLERR